MAIGFIIFLVISRWESVTHAHSGVNNVKFPEGGGLIDFESPVAMFYLVFAILLVCIYTTYAIRRSSVGRTLLSIRTSEDLADAIGVRVGFSKQLAFAASAVLGGIGGGLYATVVGFIGPHAASIDKTFEFLMFILVGGMGTVAGPLLGSMIVTFLFELFQDFQAYRFIVLGPIIVALVIFAPGESSATSADSSTNAIDDEGVPRPAHSEKTQPSPHTIAIPDSRRQSAPTPEERNDAVGNTRPRQTLRRTRRGQGREPGR
jgi:branched-chain amino acid transport system permease protein